MSVQHTRPLSRYLPSAVADAKALFTTPMANPDSDAKTSVVQDLTTYWTDSRGVGGRKPEPNAIEYSPLAALVAFYLLAASGRALSEANATRLLLQELDDEQRLDLGMTGDLTGTRYEVIAAGLGPDATPAQQVASNDALQLEHGRFAKFWSQVMGPVDPSPFKKNVKMTNRERDAILADPEHPKRRINTAEAKRNKERLHVLMNKIVAAGCLDAPTEGWNGDLAADETVVITTSARAKHGTQEHMLRSVDPDAEYWPGKKSDDFEDTGFGYGITYAVRVPRPYGTQVPAIALGMSVTKATGGRVEDFLRAHDCADMHGLTKENRTRLCVADQGYTIKNEWIPTMLRLGYRVLFDYPSGWNPSKQLKCLTAIPNKDGKSFRPTNGPELVNGCIVCPGATGLPASQLPTPKDARSKDLATIKKVRRQVAQLEAFSMPIRLGPKQVKSATRGRPKKTQEPINEFAVTVMCPALAGKVNCANRPSLNGLRDPNLPDIPNPPHPQAGQEHLRPRPCRTPYVTYRLDQTELKWLQSLPWGSHAHTDIYDTLRSINERYHSQLKEKASGGVEDDTWVRVRGIAKFSLLASIATAVTNKNIIESFASKNSAEKTTPREKQRRARQHLLRQRPKAP